MGDLAGWTVRVLAWDALPDAARGRLRAAVSEGLAGAEGAGVVVVDEHAPGVDAATVRSMVQDGADGRARVGVRPFTDTVKRLHGGVVAGTVDREGLVQVVGPLVLPGGGEVRETLEETAAAVASGVVLVEVPHRRLADGADLEVAGLSAAAAPRE